MTMSTRRDWEIRINGEGVGFVIATWPEPGPRGLGQRFVLIRASHGDATLETNVMLPRGTMDDARDKAAAIASAAFGESVELRQVSSGG